MGYGDIRAWLCTQEVISHSLQLSVNGNRSTSWRGQWLGAFSSTSAVGLSLCAVLADVTNLAATVAGLATLSIEWATIWSSAVAADVTKLATSVALHGLCLAITSVVVGATALVACSSTGHATLVTTAETATTTTAALEATTTALLS